MRTKVVFYLLSLCCLLFIGTSVANSKIRAIEMGIRLYGSPFEYPKGSEHGHRSISVAIPISAFTSENHSLELDFFEPVGEIEIIISQDGVVVYSSSENFESPSLKSILLPQNVSGNFMLEIKGSNGAYAYGNFNLN